MTFLFERTMFERVGLSLVLAAAWIGSSRPAMAADPPPKQATGSKRDQVRKDLVLKSEAWKNTLAGVDQWLSIQTMYSKKEVEEIRKRVTSRVEKMSADELEEYRQDLDARMEMVLSPEGRDILGWVAANLAAAAPAYRKKMGLDYPDVAHLTAAQLREQLDLLEEKRSSAQNQTAALDRARQARIAGLRADQQQQFQEREHALDRGARSASSPYHPSGVRQYPDVVSRPQYGWGFGFW